MGRAGGEGGGGRGQVCGDAIAPIRTRIQPCYLLRPSFHLVRPKDADNVACPIRPHSNTRPDTDPQPPLPSFPLPLAHNLPPIFNPSSMANSCLPLFPPSLPPTTCPSSISTYLPPCRAGTRARTRQWLAPRKGGQRESGREGGKNRICQMRRNNKRDTCRCVPCCSACDCCVGMRLRDDMLEDMPWATACRLPPSLPSSFHDAAKFLLLHTIHPLTHSVTHSLAQD